MMNLEVLLNFMCDNWLKLYCEFSFNFNVALNFWNTISWKMYI